MSKSGFGCPNPRFGRPNPRFGHQILDLDTQIRDLDIKIQDLHIQILDLDIKTPDLDVQIQDLDVQIRDFDSQIPNIYIQILDLDAQIIYLGIVRRGVRQVISRTSNAWLKQSTTRVKRNEATPGPHTYTNPGNRQIDGHLIGTSDLENVSSHPPIFLKCRFIK